MVPALCDIPLSERSTRGRSATADAKLTWGGSLPSHSENSISTFVCSDEGKTRNGPRETDKKTRKHLIDRMTTGIEKKKLVNELLIFFPCHIIYTFLDTRGACTTNIARLSAEITITTS